MPISKRLESYLKLQKAKFEVVKHRTVFTAYDLAATLREKLETIGKTLLIDADKRHILVVVPANRRVDFAKLKKLLGAKKVSIVSESAMVKHLKIKAGALTPFGSQHKLQVVVDAALAKTATVLLGAGSFTESLRMKMRDFVRMEQPTVGSVSESAGLPKLPVARPKKVRRSKPKKGVRRTNKSKALRRSR